MCDVCVDFHDLLLSCKCEYRAYSSALPFPILNLSHPRLAAPLEEQVLREGRVVLEERRRRVQVGRHLSRRISLSGGIGIAEQRLITLVWLALRWPRKSNERLLLASFSLLYLLSSPSSEFRYFSIPRPDPWIGLPSGFLPKIEFSSVHVLEYFINTVFKYFPLKFVFFFR